MSRSTLHVGDCREVLRTLAAESAHCAVTSPPYWGLRDYGVAGQLGLEATPEEYVARMVEVFREVRRVLRSDGTLWLNMGDSYATGAGKVGDCPGGGEQGARWLGDVDRLRDEKRGYRGDRSSEQAGKHGKAIGAMGPVTQPNRMPIPGLKPKDLAGMPWRLAFALQADGWWLRSDIVWAKPNPMPESATDRPTKSHEYVFLLARSESYYYDAEAIRERDRGLDHPRSVLDGQPSLEPTGGLMPEHKGIRTTDGRNGSGRNKRTVWTIPTAPFPGAHFATFPPALVEPCVKAGTSERGACPACGAPWRREVERVSGGKSYATGKSADKRSAGLSTGFSGYDDGSSCPVFRTTGWSPTCTCPAAEPVPCVVLDPFAGAGTTGLVACGLGRDFIGIELNPEYAEMARRRLVNEAPGALLGGVAPRSLRADDASTLFGEVPEEGGRG